MLKYVLEILKWLVGMTVTTRALDGHLIEEHEVESRPEYVSNAILDDKVDLLLVQRFFTYDAWEAVEQMVKIKSVRPVWFCPTCNKKVVNNGIVCDCCLQWQHMNCAGLCNAPKSKHWFCSKCSHL